MLLLQIPSWTAKSCASIQIQYPVPHASPIRFQILVLKEKNFPGPGVLNLSIQQNVWSLAVACCRLPLGFGSPTHEFLAYPVKISY